MTKVVILAGGLGTRLAEETEVKPKPMIEIGGKPILWHIMKSYAHYGFTEFFVALKMSLLTSEQLLSAVLARRNLYQEVERLLEAKIASNGSFLNAKLTPTNAPLSEAELYVNVLMKSSEIIKFGEPGLISSTRGALKKTGVFFLTALGLACFGAFMREWSKGLLSSR